jgi:hypothetical protein
MNASRALRKPLDLANNPMAKKQFAEWIKIANYTTPGLKGPGHPRRSSVLIARVLSTIERMLAFPGGHKSRVIAPFRAL